MGRGMALVSGSRKHFEVYDDAAVWDYIKERVNQSDFALLRHTKGTKNTAKTQRFISIGTNWLFLDGKRIFILATAFHIGKYGLTAEKLVR